MLVAMNIRTIFACAFALALSLRGVQAERSQQYSCCLGVNETSAVTVTLPEIRNVQACANRCKPGDYDVYEFRAPNTCVCLYPKEGHALGFSLSTEVGSSVESPHDCRSSTCVIRTQNDSICEDINIQLTPDSSSSVGFSIRTDEPDLRYSCDKKQDLDANTTVDLNGDDINNFCKPVESPFQQNCRQTCGLCPTPSPSATPTSAPWAPPTGRVLEGSCCLGVNETSASIKAPIADIETCADRCETEEFDVYEFREPNTCVCLYPKEGHALGFSLSSDFGPVNCEVSTCVIRTQNDSICEDINVLTGFTLVAGKPLMRYFCDKSQDLETNTTRSFVPGQIEILCDETPIFEQNCRQTCGRCPTPSPSATPTSAPWAPPTGRVLEGSCCLGVNETSAINVTLPEIQNVQACEDQCETDDFDVYEFREPNTCVCLYPKEGHKLGFSLSTEVGSDHDCRSSTCVIRTQSDNVCEDINLQLTPNSSSSLGFSFTANERSLRYSCDTVQDLDASTNSSIEASFRKFCDNYPIFEQNCRQKCDRCPTPTPSATPTTSAPSAPTTQAPTIAPSEAPEERRNVVDSCCYGCTDEYNEGFDSPSESCNELPQADCTGAAGCTWNVRKCDVALPAYDPIPCTDTIHRESVSQSECRTFCEVNQTYQGSYEFFYDGEVLTADSLGNCSCTIVKPTFFSGRTITLSAGNDYGSDYGYDFEEIPCKGRVCQIYSKGAEVLDCQDSMVMENEDDDPFGENGGDPFNPFRTFFIEVEGDSFQCDCDLCDASLCNESTIMRENCRNTCDACPTPVPTASPSTSPSASPTQEPTANPSSRPTTIPSAPMTQAPTIAPSEAPEERRNVVDSCCSGCTFEYDEGPFDSLPDPMHSSCAPRTNLPNVSQSKCRTFCEVNQTYQGSYEFFYDGEVLTADSLGNCSCTIRKPTFFSSKRMNFYEGPNSGGQPGESSCKGRVCQIYSKGAEVLDCQDSTVMENEDGGNEDGYEYSNDNHFYIEPVFEQMYEISYCDCDDNFCADMFCNESTIMRENCRNTCDACPTPVPTASPSTMPSVAPTSAPTSSSPSASPTQEPTSNPSSRQTAMPSVAPTSAPTSFNNFSVSTSGSKSENVLLAEDPVGQNLATVVTVGVSVGVSASIAGAVALEGLALEGAATSGGASLLALGVVLQRTSLLGDVEFADRAPIYRTFCQGFQWTALRFDSDDDGEVAQEASARSRQRRRLNSTTTASDVAVQRRRDRLLLEKPGFSSTLWNSLYLTLAVVAFHLACLVALRVFIARSAQHSSTSDNAGFLARMWKRLRTKIAPWPRWELMCALFLAQGTTESALLLYSVDPTPLHKAIAICLSLFGGLGSIAGCFFLLTRIGRGNGRFVKFDSKAHKWISAGGFTEMEGSASEGRDKSSHFAESYGPLFDSFRRERHAYLYLCVVAVPMQLLRSFLIGYVWSDDDGEFAGGRLQALLLFLAFAIEIVIVLIWRPSAAWWENMIIFVDLSCSAGCMLLGTVPERDAEASDGLQYAIIALTLLSFVFVLAPLLYQSMVSLRSCLCSRRYRSSMGNRSFKGSKRFSDDKEDSVPSVELCVSTRNKLPGETTP